MPQAAKIFVDLMWYRHAVPTDMDEEKVDHEVTVQLDKLRANNWNLGPKVLILARLPTWAHQADSYQKPPVKVTLLCEEEELLFNAYNESTTGDAQPAKVNHDADYSPGELIS